MSLDRKVSTIHFHVADLSFTCIPKCPIRPIIVFITVSYACITCEDKNIWLAFWCANSTLSLTTKMIVDVFDSVIDFAWLKCYHYIIVMKFSNDFINDSAPNKNPALLTRNGVLRNQFICPSDKIC